jgi:hypothetical protein
MTESLSCPTCTEVLVPHEEDSFRCPEDHHYTVVGLALTTNIAAIRALWMAIRALENDSASLRYMAKRYGDSYGGRAEDRIDEAAAADEAARLLRQHARRAQERLDALPAAPSTVTEAGSRRGRGG